MLAHQLASLSSVPPSLPHAQSIADLHYRKEEEEILLTTSA